jgi:hypothetical protein
MTWWQRTRHGRVLDVVTGASGLGDPEGKVAELLADMVASASEHDRVVAAAELWASLRRRTDPGVTYHISLADPTRVHHRGHGGTTRPDGYTRFKRGRMERYEVTSINSATPQSLRDRHGRFLSHLSPDEALAQQIIAAIEDKIVRGGQFSAPARTPFGATLPLDRGTLEIVVNESAGWSRPVVEAAMARVRARLPALPADVRVIVSHASITGNSIDRWLRRPRGAPPIELIGGI